MKRNRLSFLIFLFFCIFFSQVNAQDEQKDQLLVVWENSVIPSYVQQYEEAIKKQVILLNKTNHEIPYFIYATNDHIYYWVTPIDNYANIDFLHKAWQEFLTMAEKEDVNNQIREGFRGTLNFLKPQVLCIRSELSYMPESRTSGGPYNYFRLGMCYVNSGYEFEFEETWKEWVSLFKDNDISIGWTLYECQFGNELPYYVWGETYRDESGMASERAEAFGIMGEKSEKLWIETEKFLRKIEYKTGWFRPDLSYILQQ
jgi:hypothetical protein